MSQPPGQPTPLTPAPRHTNSPQTADATVGRPRRSRWRWLILLAPIALVMGPVLIPYETAQWYRAAALEAKFSDDEQEEIRLLNEAIRWQPNNADLRNERSEAHQRAGRFQLALQDANWLIRHRKLYRARVATYQAMNQHQLAVEDLETMRKGQTPPTLDRVLLDFPAANQANDIGYARALAGRELTQALDEANLAVEAMGGEAPAIDLAHYRKFLGALKLYNEGEFDRALDTVDSLIGRAVFWWDASRRDIAAQRDSSPQATYRYWSLTKHLATVRALRYQILSDQGQRIRAEPESQRIEQLGYQTSDFAGLPGSYEARRMGLRILSAYLDTRGWIRHQLGDSTGAMLDLNTALNLEIPEHRAYTAQQIRDQAAVEDDRAVRLRIRQRSRSLAVLHYHRAEVARRLGNNKQADKDNAAIEKLGFQPGPHLY